MIVVFEDNTPITRIIKLEKPTRDHFGVFAPYSDALVRVLPHLCSFNTAPHSQKNGSKWQATFASEHNSTV